MVLFVLPYLEYNEYMTICVCGLIVSDKNHQLLSKCISIPGNCVSIKIATAPPLSLPNDIFNMRSVEDAILMTSSAAFFLKFITKLQPTF